jgi:hypothetical protein
LKTFTLPQKESIFMWRKYGANSLHDKDERP